MLGRTSAKIVLHDLRIVQGSGKSGRQKKRPSLVRDGRLDSFVIRRNSGESEFTDSFTVSTSTKSLINAVVNILTDESGRSIGQNKLSTTGVTGLEALTGLPVLPVVASRQAVARCAGIPRDSIQALTDTGDREVDGGCRRNPQRIEVEPSIATMVATLGQDFSTGDGVGSSIRDGGNICRPVDAGENPRGVGPAFCVAMTSSVHAEDIAVVRMGVKVTGTPTRVIRWHVLITHAERVVGF